MTLLDHAAAELRIARSDDDLACTPPIADGILDVVAGFAEYGHSGGSASIVAPRVGWILGRLLAFEPITPLTGDDDEWQDVADRGPADEAHLRLQQNRRCGRVFREQHDGRWIAYDIDATYCVDLRDWIRGRGDVAGWQRADVNARRISFPYMPGPARRIVLRRPRTLIARLRGELRP